MNNYRKTIRGGSSFNRSKIVYFSTCLFWWLRVLPKRLWHSALMMTRWEKIAASIFLCAALGGFGVRTYWNYLGDTTPVASAGGTYTEAVVGESKYLNPLLAQSDADRSVCSLLFSGLIKFQGGSVVPDLADHWEISSDGLKYTFFLKKDVVFHDGAPLTANDVIYTIDTIKNNKDEGTQSFLYDAWKDVKITAIDGSTVVFELPKPYGPFLTHLDMGIIPAHLSNDDFNRRFIGTGPFKFESFTNAGGQVKGIHLVRNDQYYAGKPLLLAVDFIFFGKEDEARKAFDQGKTDGLFGVLPTRTDVYDLSYKSSKQLGLLFNLRNDKFKDKTLRQKILGDGAVDGGLKLRLVALNAPLQHQEAEALKQKLANQNIQLELIYLNPLQLKEVLDSREFEMILYGFNFGHDRDPYALWHSSQVDLRNISGYADKQSDIMLEDARMTLDDQGRNAKYDQFYALLQQESLAKFSDPVRYLFSADLKVGGIKPAAGSDPGSRFAGISDWFVKEKRVKK